MGIEGLSDQRNTILTEINRCLGMVLKEENEQNISDFVHTVFTLLKKIISRNQYKNAVLECISTLAKGVFALNSHALVDDLIEGMIRMDKNDLKHKSMHYIQYCVPLILIIMRTLRKLTESEKSYWGTGDYGIVENGKVLFQGTYKGCLQWLGS